MTGFVVAKLRHKQRVGDEVHGRETLTPTARLMTRIVAAKLCHKQLVWCGREAPSQTIRLVTGFVPAKFRRRGRDDTNIKRQHRVARNRRLLLGSKNE